MEKGQGLVRGDSKVIGGWHLWGDRSVHPLPFPFLLGGRGVEPPTKFLKKEGGAWQDLIFERGVAGKDGGNVFQGGGGLESLHI